MQDFVLCVLDVLFMSSRIIFLKLDFQADVLVSSLGASYQAIVNTGVPAMASPNVGDITVSPGSPLCSHVIHTNCCKWQGGQGEVVSTIKYKVLSFYPMHSITVSIKDILSNI